MNLFEFLSQPAVLIALVMSIYIVMQGLVYIFRKPDCGEDK